MVRPGILEKENVKRWDVVMISLLTLARGGAACNSCGVLSDDRDAHLAHGSEQRLAVPADGVLHHLLGACARTQAFSAFNNRESGAS